MQKHKLISNKFTLNYISTFIKLIHNYISNTVIMNEGLADHLYVHALIDAKIRVDPRCSK